MRNYSVSPIIREMQIKSLLCSHPPQIGWPLLKKNKSKKFWSRCRERGIHTHLVGMHLGTIENNMDIYQKLKIQLACNSSIPLLVKF